LSPTRLMLVTLFYLYSLVDLSEWMSMCIMFIFFFSSRRRHTRSKRDWSSDVCSSDLVRKIVNLEPELNSFSDTAGALMNLDLLRSEERRVGKECRCGWEADH